MAVEFLLENLKQLLLYNINLIDGIKDEVESLYNDLSFFRAFLKESTDSHGRQQNEVLKGLVKQIRDVVYETEDAVDTFVVDEALYKAWKPSKIRPIEKPLHVLVYPAKLRMLAKEIQLIQMKVKENNKFGFGVINFGDGSDTGKTEKKKGEEILKKDNNFFDGEEILKKDNFFDLEEKAQQVIEQLLIQGSKHLKVISIAGGLGKTPLDKMIYRTTLAKMIYLDLRTKFQFPTRLWVYISQTYNRKEVFLNILETLDELTNDYHKMSAESLAHELHKILKKRKYLIILDNVSTEEAWDDLKTTFPNNRSGCRILITSRIQIVDESVDAFIAMDQQKRVGKFIDLSYSHLPYHLKACFVYFGMFPKDFEIPVWKLIRLWVAEGFIQRSQDMSPEDIALEYLEDLVNRNLVMAGKFRLNGKIKTCRVHDMLHDFCKKIAAEDNFFQEIKRFDHDSYTDVTSNPALERYRRLCIHSRVFNYLSSNPMGPLVRSFLCFSDEKTVLESEHVSSIPSAFKLLRVLDACSVTLTHFPRDLTQLVHLKYIVLSIHFKALPDRISSLWNLQTLVVFTTERTLDFRANLWTMIQLRHVKTNASMALPGPDSKSRKTAKDENMMARSLQTLSMISPECCTEDVFGRAPNLKVLGVRGQLHKLLENKNGNMLFDSFGKLSHLENLKLLNEVFPRAQLATLPQTHKFPPKLRKLTLSSTLLDWNDMSTLGMLENLEILKLEQNAFKGELWQPDEGGFRALKVLHIERNKLINWNASAIHFPRLMNLFIRHCSNLVSIPLGFADILSLQLIDLHYTTASSAASAIEIQQAKKEMQGKVSGRGVVFKLSIYPDL